MNCRLPAFALFTVLATGAAQAQPAGLQLMYLTDDNRQVLGDKPAECRVELIKLPEGKPVGLISERGQALLNIGDVLGFYPVQSRSALQVKFGGVVGLPTGEVKVEAQLTKNGAEDLCKPIGCRSIPARMVLDITAADGKLRAIDSNVLVQDPCGRDEKKRLMN